MMKFQLYLFLLLASLTQLSCSKKTETEKTKEEVAAVEEKGVDHPSDQYVSLIQKNTTLIKTITASSTTTPYPGIEETVVTYISNRDVAMAIFFLKVDLSNPAISMEAGTPNDRNSFGTQTVRNMITHKNANSTSKYVIAATNGDYYDENAVPLGLVYKDGILIRNQPDKYYFLSILKDNTCVIGDSKNYIPYVTRMKESLGARYQLVKDAVVTTEGLDENIEPRTAVGVINSKKLVFLIVDGRRPGYSSGLSLTDEANILKAIGVRDAVNLDGGGSTTYVLRNAGGTYEVRNRPSADAERAVANSWMIMSNK